LPLRDASQAAWQSLLICHTGEETVSQLFFDKRILEKDKKARESFLCRCADMIEYR
jgi:hypothetical protein